MDAGIGNGTPFTISKRDGTRSLMTKLQVLQWALML